MKVEDLKFIENFLRINKAKGNIGFIPKQKKKNTLVQAKNKPINVCTEQDGKVLMHIGENDKFYSPDTIISKKFIKVMVDEKEIAKMLMGNPTTYAVLGIIKSCLVPNQNYLMKDGRKYKPIDLAREIGISAQAASRHFKILEKANLISEYKVKNGKVWVVNPNYYLSGATVPKRILDLFEKRKP